MEWNFKLKPGDNVWFMYDNRARLGKVTRAWYTKNVSCVDFETVSEVEKYHVALPLKDEHCDLKEVGYYKLEELFPDKESLLKSL